MTQLVRKFIGNYSDVEKVLKDTQYSFEEYVNNIINKYKGKSQKELMKELSINSNAKNINSLLINKMFNVRSNLAETEEFQKLTLFLKQLELKKMEG